LIRRKISKFDATRCQILRLKCTKFDFRWDSAPDPAGGAYSAPQTSWLDLRGPASKGREGVEREEGREMGGDAGRERRRRLIRDLPDQRQTAFYAPVQPAEQ